MDSVVYKPGHGLSIDLIKEVLQNLGCSEIKDNEYDIKNRGIEFDGLRPDIICSLNNKNVAVEVGILSQQGDLNRIQQLLISFDYVIHLFQDKKFLLLHSVIYSKKKFFSGDIIRTLKNQQSYCVSLLRELESDV